MNIQFIERQFAIPVGLYAELAQDEEFIQPEVLQLLIADQSKLKVCVNIEA